MEVEQVISAPKSYLARNANPIRHYPFNDFYVADSPHLVTTNIAPTPAPPSEYLFLD